MQPGDGESPLFCNGVSVLLDLFELFSNSMLQFTQKKEEMKKEREPHMPGRGARGAEAARMHSNNLENEIYRFETTFIAFLSEPTQYTLIFILTISNFYFSLIFVLLLI